MLVGLPAKISLPGPTETVSEKVKGGPGGGQPVRIVQCHGDLRKRCVCVRQRLNEQDGRGKTSAPAFIVTVPATGISSKCVHYSARSRITSTRILMQYRSLALPSQA